MGSDGQNPKPRSVADDDLEADDVPRADGVSRADDGSEAGDVPLADDVSPTFLLPMQRPAVRADADDVRCIRNVRRSLVGRSGDFLGGRRRAVAYIFFSFVSF